MITRPAVRLERAGLFLLKAGKYFIGDRLGDIELFNARMDQMRIADCGLRDQTRFDLVQAMV